MQQILSKMRKAIEEYNMLEEGDKIAVCLSGGKDSITLLNGLKALQRFYPKHFELIAISVNPGFKEFDKDLLQKNCDEVGVPLFIEDSNIKEIVFDIRKEKNPCSLCAKLRRGALNDAAMKLGCTKVALGHHKDDAVETFVMAMFYEGRVNCFSPKSYMEKYNLSIIRPMVYIDEYMIKKTVKDNGYPIIKNPCIADGHTKRQEVKELIKNLQGTFPNLKEKLFSSLNNSQQLFIWDKQVIRDDNF